MPRRRYWGLRKIRKLVSNVKKGEVKAVSIHEWVLLPQEIGVLRKNGWRRKELRIIGREGKFVNDYIWFSPAKKN